MIVYVIEYQRIEDQMVAQVEQEFDELRRAAGQSAATGGTPYASVGDLLDTFLPRNVPDDDEVLVSWYDDGRRSSSPTGTADFAELDRSSAQTVRPAARPTTAPTTVDVPGYGDAMLTVQTRHRRRPGRARWSW